MQLGPYTLRNTVALAPMAGLSDVPFRALAWRMGAGYMVSEMLGSKPQLWDTGKSRLRRIVVPGVYPVAVQIAGTDPQVMADAAQRHADEGAQVVDLNFGCPAKKVCRKAAGSALLSDLDLIARIVGAVVRAVDVPVTVKTRVGLTPGDDLGLQAGLVAASEGAQMLTLHGRSRACKFSGPVNYTPIGVLKDLLARRQLDVPVLVNGDIDSVARARQALALSGADGVMVGRAALGQPWLFSELTGREMPRREEKFKLILQHVADMHHFYGEMAAVGIVRKHVIAYLQRLGMDQKIRGFLGLTEAPAQLHYLRRVFAADNRQSEASSRSEADDRTAADSKTEAHSKAEAAAAAA